MLYTLIDSGSHGLHVYDILTYTVLNEGLCLPPSFNWHLIFSFSSSEF